MARQVLPIVGAVIGGQLGFAIGAIIGNAIDPQVIKTPGIQDLPVQTASEGGYRQVVYGTCWIKNTNIIDFGDVRRVTQRERQGKGGGPVVESERLYRTYAIGLGEPLAAIRVIRRDGKIVYDVRPGSTILADSAEFAERFRFYTGADDQLPDPDLEALSHNGVGNTPYYRGTAYLVFANDDLTDTAGRIPTYEVEGVVDPASVGVAWDEENTSATAQLSLGNTRMAPLPTASTGIYANSRSNVPLTGLAYISGTIDAAAMSGAVVGFGISDAGQDWTDQTNWVGKNANSAGVWAPNGNVYQGGSIIGNSPDFSTAGNNDPQIAVNVSTRKYWIRGDNGAWVGGGNPATGASPTGTLGGTGDIYVVGTCSVNAPLLNRHATIHPTAAETTGTVPSGFTAAGYTQPTSPGSTVQLADVLDDVCDRCGLLSAERDFSSLSDTMDGVTLGGNYNGASAVTMLMPAYFFDITQPEKELVAVKRGGAAVETVTDAGFVELPDENILRGQDIEYPRLMMLRYLNPAQNYEAPAATVSRTSPDIRVRGEATADLPVSFDETGALKVADRMLKVMWEDLNGEVTFSLPLGPYAWLTPTDCIGLSIRGALYRVRVESIEEADGALKVKARRDRQSAYTSNLTATPLPTPTPPPTSSTGDTTAIFMNAPVLRDEDDRLGLRVALYGDSAWYGANIAYSVDGGVSYTNLGNYYTKAVMGQLTAALPSASPYYTDNTNTLSVEINDDSSLDSLTTAELLSEGNSAAIVKANNLVEIVQFKTASDLTGNNWNLTGLLRGRLNTTPATHASGADFVLLETTEFVELPSSLIGQTVRFRVTSLGKSPETAPTYDVSLAQPVSQTEFAVVDLAAEVEGGLLNVSWIPRHRLGTEILPAASSNFTGYRVTISDGTESNTFATTDSSIELAYGYIPGSPSVTVEGINRFGVQGESATVATGLAATSALAVENGGFESGDTGWTADPDNLAGTFTITEDNTKALTGDWLSIYAGGAGFGGARSDYFNDLVALPERYVTFAGSARIPGLTANSPVVVVYPFMEAYDLAGEVILRWAAPGIVGRFGVSGDTAATSERTVDLFLYRNRIASVRFGFEVYHASVGTADFEVYLDDFTITADGREL